MIDREVPSFLSTECNSPRKLFGNRIFTKKKVDSDVQCIPIATNIKQQSVTEQEIMSHDLIRQVVVKKNSETILHDINIIEKQAKLYAKPTSSNPSQYKFNSIPPQNPDYASQCANTIDSINKKIQCKTKISDRIRQKIYKTKKTDQKSSRSWSTSVPKKISVSGLVSYSFNSVSARKSLGFKNQNQEEVFQKKLECIKQIQNCSMMRHNKILRKKSAKKATWNNEINQGITCDYQSPTNLFLKTYMKQKKQDQCTYGESVLKLRCTQEYMKKQGVGAEEAYQIIQVISKGQNQDCSKKPKTSRPKMQIDEDYQLNNRKKIIGRRVMLRNLCFAE